MARFPKIQSPCPHRDNLAEVIDGDFCRACETQVIDITAWSDAEREALVRGASGKICVSYRPALVAAAMAAAVAALPAAAQDLSVSAAGASEISLQEPLDDSYDDEIVVGGITDPAKAEFVEQGADRSIPELPVIEEDAAPAKPAGARPAT